MGAKGAVEIIFRGKDVEERSQEYTSTFENPLRAAERGFVDAIIDPADTRRILIEDLDMLATKEPIVFDKKHGNIPL